MQIKLKLIRDKIGYVQNDMDDRSSSIDYNNQKQQQQQPYQNTPSKHNQSLQLPELKSVTPQLANVKQHYSLVTGGSLSYTNNGSAAKLMNRK